MESPDKPLKIWQTLLAVVLFLPAGLWLGGRTLVCFEETGQWWRGRVKDSFVETQARVENVWAKSANTRYGHVAVEIFIQASYEVDGVGHRIVDVEERTGPKYGADYERMQARAKEIRHTLPTTRVFYDPANHGYAVLKKENLPTFFSSAVLAFFGCIMGLMALALVAMGVMPIVMGLRAVAVRFLPRKKPKPVLRPRTEPKPEPPKAEPQPQPPREPSPLTGDPQKDYYSGALADHALASWDGFWCEIFQMPDSSIVVVHDDSTHHYFRTWSVEDVLAGRADVPFDESQQEERESFEQRIRQQHG